MKITWGTGIALFYITFMGAMITMVYKSTLEDRNLVVENYYEKDLQYQAHLDRLNNTKLLKADLEILAEEKAKRIRFVFPAELEKIDGEILFYRASDRHQDLKADINLNDGREFIFPTKTLQKGIWKVKVNWRGDQIPFYKETSIRIR
ncbi:MAG: FixH family protein [Bacteroidota bacterium]